MIYSNWTQKVESEPFARRSTVQGVAQMRNFAPILLIVAFMDSFLSTLPNFAKGWRKGENRKERGCMGVAKGSPGALGSGAGTNLKVGAPIQRKSGGGHRFRKNIFFGRAPPLFGSKSTISRFGERFRDSQYSLISFLFAVLLLAVSPVPSHL